MFYRVARWAAASGLFLSALIGGPLTDFAQTNLVSNIPGLAATTDPLLVNPWGISSSATSPFWVSDNGTGVTTLYNSAGVKQGLVVTIPAPGGGTSAPTGQVFNSTGTFNNDIFLFASEDGAISGWRGALGTTAELLFDNSGSNAVYKGLAIGSTAQGTYLYAADFHNGMVSVFPSTGAPALTGNFVDPSLPAGYAPFNVQLINGQLYVTYAKQDGAAHDDVAGPGNGYIDVFDLNGNFIKRLVSGGALDSPWGMAVAPASWGSLSGDLLVGNFGDGTINAFDTSGNLLGTLADVNGNSLVNSGVWGLKFGNGGNGGSANSLYITAGLNGEQDGLFARIDAVPEPGTVVLFGSGLAFFSWRISLRRRPNARSGR